MPCIHLAKINWLLIYILFPDYLARIAVAPNIKHRTLRRTQIMNWNGCDSPVLAGDIKASSPEYKA